MSIFVQLSHQHNGQFAGLDSSLLEIPIVQIVVEEAVPYHKMKFLSGSISTLKMDSLSMRSKQL